LIHDFWPSDDGQMPLDEPKCGYRGERCDYTIEIVVTSVVITVAFVAVLIMLIYRYWFGYPN
jgi:hypothetical protein